jgi:hypothetical protein
MASTTIMHGSATPANADPLNPPSTMAPKLHGRAFYEAIGSPKHILAPMVDQSEFVRACP